MTVREDCSCGASVEVTGPNLVVQLVLRDFHQQHRCHPEATCKCIEENDAAVVTLAVQDCPKHGGEQETER